VFAAAVVVLATAALAVAAAPELAIDEEQQSNGITWSPGFAFERAYLNVGGPAGVIFERSFDAADQLSWDLTDENGLSLIDGDYSYGLLVIRSLSPQEAQALEEAEAEAVRLRDEAERLSLKTASAGELTTESEVEVKAAAALEEREVQAAQHRAMAAEKRVEEVQVELEELNGPFVVQRSSRFAVRGGVFEFERAPDAESQADGGIDATPGREIAAATGGPVAKITETNSQPSIFFDDTQDEDCSPGWDWRVIAEGGTGPLDYNNVFGIYGTGECYSAGAFTDMQILRLEHDGNNDANSSINSILVQSNGDIWMGDGTWIFDKSTDAISLGKGTIPSEDIEIWDSGPGVRLHDITDGTYGTYFYNSPNLGILGNSSQYISRIDATAPANSIWVNADGELGLGGDPNVNWGLTDLAVVDVVAQLELQSTSYGNWAMMELTSDHWNFLIEDSAGTGHTYPLRIWEDSPTASIDIRPAGVGIGTANPTRKLHVVPDVAGQVVALFQNGTHEISRNDGGFANIRFATSGGPVTQSWLFQNSPTNGEFVIRNQTTPGNPLRILRDAPANSVVMRSTGVGIRTGTPAGALDVNGSIYQRGGIIHADYVFEPGYDLPSIEEHARLMWANSHLPAVPPRQMDEAGREVVEVGAQRRGILEELEVAHIYIEQLEKRMGQQEERLNQLEALLAELE
jgi:hypothetical protein